MEETNSNRERLKIVVLLLIGFIIGFATHAFTSVENTAGEETENSQKEELLQKGTTTVSEIKTTGQKVSSEETNIQEVDVAINNISLDGYSFSIIDQPAGNTVHVANVTAEKEMWVAIREDSNGTLGNILGASLYGTKIKGDSVELLRNTRSESLYYAVIYIDDGDQTFDFKKDTLLTDPEGKVIAVKFRTY